MPSRQRQQSERSIQMAFYNSEDGDEYSMWSRPFTFGSVNIRVEESWGLGIGGTVWEGGVLLAQYLSSPAFCAEQYRGSRCIEIGAGVTALPSISAAHLNTFSQIIVTDIEECIEALHENLAANLPHSCQLTSLGCQAAQPPAGRVGDCHASRRGELDGWDVPQSVIEVAAQDLATLSKPSATTKEPPGSHPRDSSDGYSVLNGHANGSATDRAGLGEAVQSNGAISVGSDLEVTQAETAQQRGSCQCISTSAVHHHDPQDREQQHVETPTGTAMLCDVVVHILDWRDDPSFLQPPFSVLLVADVVYIAELMQPLLECMHKLSSDGTFVILAYYERSASAAQEFWSLLPQFFNAVKIPEASFGASAQPDNVGLFQLRKLRI